MPKGFSDEPFPPPATELNEAEARILVLISAARARLLATQLQRLSLRFEGVLRRELEATSMDLLRADATLRAMMME